MVVKVLLHDPADGRYFRALGQWTEAADAALSFADIDEALELALGLGYGRCELVLSSEALASEIRFPVAPPDWTGKELWNAEPVTEPGL